MSRKKKADVDVEEPKVQEAPEQSTQLDLIPEEIPQGRLDVIPLAELPPDEELPGGPPTRQMVESVERYGVLEPIICRVREIERPEGYQYVYEVVDGRRRVKAARAARQEMITATVYPFTFSYSEVVTIIANTHRRPNPMADLLAMRSLIQRGASETDICKATGWTKQEYRAKLPLLGLNEVLLAGVSTGVLPVSVAQSAAKRSERDQARLAETFAEKGKLTLKDVDAVRHVTLAEGAASLPRSLFEPIEDDEETDDGRLVDDHLKDDAEDLGHEGAGFLYIPWYTQVVLDLQDALTITPESYTLLRKRLEPALKAALVQQEIEERANRLEGQTKSPAEMHESGALETESVEV